MKSHKIIAALALAQIASPALAEKWTAVGTTGIRVADVQRSGDLVTFIENIRVAGHEPGMTSEVMMDCTQRLTYVKTQDGGTSPGHSIEPKSIEEAELNYVCASAP